ncbi:hypothetical protein B0H67DRAFT_549038 [Lasiosphaeris hirsuta]|uniref:GRF-type domain-containing protein n=1 Tax=Lasiosphaeris hirsuta TaxID=260670 RepID=A0AA40BBI2_9PEZI|nr:hypothetical protein B0H67DRAFT_549038 [Lasiosphaeris hirsuta]
MPPPGTPRTLGTFKPDQGWFCDCDPPRPGDRFTVHKQGANNGRRFYTCGKPHDIQCGFWVWEEKAQEIETMVLTRAAAQKAQQAQKAIKAGELEDTQTSMPTPSAAAGGSQPLVNLAVKPRGQRIFRGAGAGQDALADSDNDDSDEDYSDDGDNGDGDNDELPDFQPRKTRNIIVSPFSTAKAKMAPTTPKPAKKRRLAHPRHGEGTDTGANIANQNGDSDLHPDEAESEGDGQGGGYGESNGKNEDHHYDGKGKNAATTGQGSITTSQDKSLMTPSRPQTWGNAPVGLPTPVTKSAHRSRLFFASNGNQSSSKRLGVAPDVFMDDHDLTADVMGLLEDQKLEESVKQTVRQRLNTYVLQLRGIEAGRDATRAALKIKEVQVKKKELQIKMQEAEIEQLKELLENERRTHQKKMAILEDMLSNGDTGR